MLEQRFQDQNLEGDDRTRAVENEVKEKNRNISLF